MTSYAAFATFGLALASPIRTTQSEHEFYDCNSFTLPISVTNVPTAVFPTIQDQYEATNLLNIATNRVQAQNAPQMTTINGTYDILAQYCSPKGQAITTLQILTHGIGFNLSYWDFYPSANSSDDQYSYVAAAAAAGHSTLSYNRLGIAGSTLAEPFSEVQTLVELAILVEITGQARAGNIPGQQGTPSKVIHIGHSYGSILTNGLVASRPDLSDGIVLTGYSHLFDWQSHFAANSNFMIASLANPEAFPASRYSTGYFTWPSKWANQYSFFAYPNFAKDVLDDAEATKQPPTFGEILSFGLLGELVAPAFTKPVLYLNGEKDAIFCASNCTGLVEPGTLAFAAFNGTSDIESQIVQGFGHGMNLHLGAKVKMYSLINDWIARKGF